MKYLRKPVAADWNDDWTNPLVDWLMLPRLTNERGEVEFNGLSFAPQGNLGASSAVYTLQFRCGSALSQEFNVTVSSRISSITLKHPNITVIGRSYENQFDTDLFLTILDDKGFGVPGKIIDYITVSSFKQLYRCFMQITCQ